MAAEVRAETADVAAVADLFADWTPGIDVTVGEVLRWDGGLVECLQAHTTQADWTPDQTPALWKVHRPAGAVADWVQPSGGHDAYAAGDLVTHNGATWQSTVDANVWAPGVYGWEQVG